MIYEYDLAVSAGTTQEEPAEQRMKLSRGIIHKLEVSFPPGCNNLVLVTIRRALHQVWPTNPDGQLKANGHTISMPVWYELETEPYELEVKAWSPDCSYDHTITVRIGISPRGVLERAQESLTLIRRISSFLMGRRS